MLDPKFTTNTGIIAQILAFTISINGIFLKIPKEHYILQRILTIELFVGIIQLFFYLYFIKVMIEKALPKVASIRYIDWSITTPIMLLTIILFFKYLELVEKNDKTNLSSFKIMEFIKENKNIIIILFISNLLMLLFGYLGEINIIDKEISIIIGFIFFALTFYIIYENYAKKSKKSKIIFYFIFIIWGLYGIGAMLNPANKNNTFNILDIFAKNFFCVYLFYEIFKIYKNTKNLE